VTRDNTFQNDTAWFCSQVPSDTKFAPDIKSAEAVFTDQCKLRIAALLKAAYFKISDVDQINNPAWLDGVDFKDMIALVKDKWKPIEG
jgi:hypothetical protein